MNKPLRILWVGDFFSTLGASIYLLAITLLAHQFSGSIYQASLVLFSGTVPYFIFGLIGGAAADKYNKKKLMIYCEIIRTVLVLIIPLLYYFDKLSIMSLIAVSMLLTTFRAFYFPASQASVYVLLDDKEKLSQVNSYFNITKNIASMIGPSFGGIFLLFNISIPTLLIINGIAYGLSAIVLCFLNFPDEDIEESSKKDNMLISAWKGLVYIFFENKGITVMMFAFFCQLLLGVGVIQLAIPDLLNSLNLSSEELLGFVLSTITLSSIASSVVMARVKIKSNVKWLFIGYSLRSIVFIILAFSVNFLMILLASLIMGISFTIGGITMTTYLQSSSKEEMLGRVLALRSILGNITDGLAYLLVGFLLTVFNLFWGFISMSIFAILSVLISIFLWKMVNKTSSKDVYNKKREMEA